MTASQTLTLIAEPMEGGEGWRILAPAVGLYAQAPKEGNRFRAGDAVGCLMVLDRVVPLQLPSGVAGFVSSAPPEKRHQPVGYGELLFEMQAGAGGEAWDALADPAAAVSESGLPIVRASQAGRFYRKADPDSPNFVEAGDELQAGRTLGLLEVMKTFNPVKYTADGGLPGQAKVVRFLVEDSSDVEEGQALLEVEEL
jgi:acetyl-CoA carboxylase biotin carboxyl carrier protein